MLIKITPTQQRILGELAKPKGKTSVHKPEGFAFINSKAVRYASLWALLQKGLIEDVTPKEQ